MKWKRTKKTMVALSAICLGVAGTSLGVIYAWVVPGVDRPYDPPNYYSLTSISWADSAPSPFALRDLAGQGGNVYDYTRHIKSILYGTKFATWLEKLTAKLGIEERNSQQISDEKKGEGLKDYESLRRSIEGNATKIDLHPEVFDRDYDDGVPGKDTDKRAAAMFVSESYGKAIGHTAQRYQDMDAINAAIMHALDNSNNAVGETQALQAGAQIEAIKQLAIMSLTGAISDQIQIKNVRQMRDQDDRNEQSDLQQRGTYHVFTQLDSNDREMLKSYEKDTGNEIYRSKPMPDF
ncbi:hypothetical protein [Selenomonas artemidis]|jgi:hypothetical protein|uniref:hypothetical protein n=1 Tax=Selenomonas artemidis TaxID=671224 RepID=UPI0023F35891|nr:hypothetical protein [Selenomonas artemidis]